MQFKDRRTFMVIQIARGGRLSDEGRHGVLEPVNADGFYDSREFAEDVARVMAAARPDLETMVVEVVADIA